jgi:hypothetical protein
MAQPSEALADRDKERGSDAAALFGQPDHLAVRQARSTACNSCAFAAVNLVRAEVARPAFRAGPISLPQERPFGAASLRPTHAVADGGKGWASMGNPAR